MTKVYMCVTFFVLFLGSNAFATKTAADLDCTPAVVNDAGYEVTATQTSEDTYALQISKIQGWRDNIVQFSGPAHLLTEKAGESCQYKLVDDIKEPKTVVLLHPGSSHSLESLNGTSLKNFPGNEDGSLSRLKCKATPGFVKSLPPCPK